MSHPIGTNQGDASSVVIEPSAHAGGGRWRDFPVGFAVFGILVVAAMAYVAFSTEGFFTVQNFKAILRTSAIVGIVAVAMTPIMLSGNFVSLGIQQSAMAGMLVFIALVGVGWNPLLAILVVILALILLGILQALLIIGGLNPVITTLAAGAVVFGVVTLFTGGGIVQVGENTVSWGDLVVLGIPIEVLVFLFFTLLVTAISQGTVIGRHTLLVGANRETAKLSGVSFARVTILAFVVFSVGLGIAAALNGAAFGQGTIFSFTGLTIDAIAAILVGGAAIQGGRGSPLYSAVGAIVVSISLNIMTLNAWSTGFRLFLQGAIVVGVVVSLQVLRTRRARS